ncbi:MAG: ATP-binding cassette domain-containing protein, partial [Clostridia bacterium]|nr:ATP-binding cassette domain-containing protein [Clostridia bacterium]
MHIPQFKNVTLELGGTRVIKNLNFTIEPGQTLAIVGPTGSGKSMIINLLSRFYDPT